MVKKTFLDNFELGMRGSRYFILIAVFTCILASILMFVWSLKGLVASIIGIFEMSQKQIIVETIVSIDFFLLGVITMIFGWSLYELFIRNPNEKGDKKNNVPSALIVHSLDELKDKLTSVIIILLIITFFKHAFYFEFKTIYELLAFALAIAFIGITLYFTKNKTKK